MMFTANSSVLLSFLYHSAITFHPYRTLVDGFRLWFLHYKGKLLQSTLTKAEHVLSVCTSYAIVIASFQLGTAPLARWVW